jgi:hypothetical protein
MTNKCAHPACNCTVSEGKMYCSDKCATDLWGQISNLSPRQVWLRAPWV